MGGAARMGWGGGRDYGLVLRVEGGDVLPAGGWQAGFLL